MSNRRQFFGTLARALILPIAGTGAVSFADPNKAAALPVTATAMPFSADCLELRRIKRTLAALDHSSGGPTGIESPWYQIMTNEYHPVKMRRSTRPAKTWTDCVELAEIIWTAWEKEHRDGYYEGPEIATLAVHPNRVGPGSFHCRHAIAALVEGVLALGGGERFDPRIGEPITLETRDGFVAKAPRGGAQSG